MIFAASILAVLLLLPFMRAPERALKRSKELSEKYSESPSRIHHDDIRRLLRGYQLAFHTYFPALVTEMLFAESIEAVVGVAISESIQLHLVD